MLKHVDAVASNVPGFDLDVYVAGARVERFVAFGPTLGAAANVTLMSYGDHCDIGLTTDVGAVEDPEVLLACMQEASTSSSPWPRQGTPTGTTGRRQPTSRSSSSRNDSNGRVCAMRREQQMSDVNERLSAIEARLDELERTSVESRLEQFRGRIDDLRVQSSLARLDARDEVKASFDSVESAWREVRSALENLGSDGRSAGATVAEKAKAAFGDLRSALERATDSLRQKDD
jgi:hypothetical protein